MKKQILYLGLALLGAVSLTACHVDDPDASELKPSDWTTAEEPDEEDIPQSPYSSINLTYVQNETNNYFDNLSVGYDYTGKLISNLQWLPMPIYLGLEFVDTYNAPFRTYSFTNDLNTGRPTSYTMEFQDMQDYEHGFPTTKEEYTDVQWNDRNCIVSETRTRTVTYVTNASRVEETTVETSKLTYVYDNDGHIKSYTVETEGEEPETYRFVWDEKGNLTSSDSEFYGEQEYTYTNVYNVVDIWDPLLPVIGPMQAFGWYGKCPVNYVKTVSGSYDYTVNYELSYFRPGRRVIELPSGVSYSNSYNFNYNY